MAELKVHSRKESLPKELLYPLKAGELAAAFQPKITRDAHLDLSFHRTQAYWKEQRDRIQEEGRYTLARCTYYTRGLHLRSWGHAPWAHEERPQVITANVLAIPRAVLPKGSSIHAAASSLVCEAVAVLVPRGLPRLTQRGQMEDDAWHFELELDSSVHLLRAKLQPWTGGSFGLQTVECPLTPEVDPQSHPQTDVSDSDQDPT
ncbi:hypothetical protein [Hyalangium minutum]|nr:hypothetical protein [Hyalangium minutum]